MQRIGLSRNDIEQQVLRTIFNIVGRNCDDHVKNIAFFMDRRGEWRLSPAFNVSYAWNPQGEWTSQHQMSISGFQLFIRIMLSQIQDSQTGALPLFRKSTVIQDRLDNVHACFYKLYSPSLFPQHLETLHKPDQFLSGLAVRPACGLDTFQEEWFVVHLVWAIANKTIILMHITANFFNLIHAQSLKLGQNIIQINYRLKTE